MPFGGHQKGLSQKRYLGWEGSYGISCRGTTFTGGGGLLTINLCVDGAGLTVGCCAGGVAAGSGAVAGGFTGAGAAGFGFVAGGFSDAAAGG